MFYSRIFADVKVQEKFMSRCIQLAKNGLGTTYPNPMVGSVIVHNETIIGEGWHRKAGEPHAEVNAIRSVSDEALLSEATIYVSLEPCSHFGKTPPCSDLIISKGITKIVIGSTDPNPQVAGRGIKKLMEAGCEVVVGVLEEECFDLNRRFFTFHTKKRPYIVLKWAQTQNGFIAPEKSVREGTEPYWITGSQARQWVHKQRAEEQAILVGTQTVLDDNPSLTVRDWKGTSPLRVILDRTLRIPEDFNIFKNGKTLVLTEVEKASTETIAYEKIDFSKAFVNQVCEVLHQRDIQSLIVEGGRHTLQTFLDEGMWDEAYVFIGNSTFEGGVKAPEWKGSLHSKKHLENDLLLHIKNNAH